MLKFKNQSIPSLVPKNYKSSFVSEKIKLILPELLARNIKLSDRVKGKLKVSTFLNNTEIRNQKYLKYFLSSSDKRVKDIRTGLELTKAIKQSTKNLSNLCTKLDNDIILKNSDFLNNEKKLLNENTEQETHMKINNLLLILKNTIKNNKLKQRTQNTENIKYLSKSYMNNVKSILNNKLENENNIVNYKINSYKSKLKTIIEEKKDFKSFIGQMDITNLKLLNYRKPQPIPITDRECSSMARIKNNLFPLMKQQNKNIKKQILNLNQKNITHNLSFNENGKCEIQEKDTFRVLKSLASNGHNLPLKISKTEKKINSLLDIILPNPNIYHNLLEKNREKQLGKKSFEIKNEVYKEDKFEKIIKDQEELDRHVNNKLKLQKIVDTFKYQINKVKKYQLSYNQRNPHNKFYITQKSLLENFNKIKRKNKKNENSIYDDQTTSIMSKRLKKNSLSNSKIKGDDSSFFNNSIKHYESMSMRENKNNNQSYLSGINKNSVY